MYAPNASTTPSRRDQVAEPRQSPASNLASSWAQGRRRITPWAYPYLRALGAVRLIVGIFLAGLGALFLSHGHDGDAVVVLIGAALVLAIGILDSTAARSAHPRA